MKFRFIFTVLLLVACLAFCAAADEARFLPGSDAVVFVDGVNGSDENEGTDSAPVCTLGKAYASLAEAGGTVVVAGEVSVGESAFSPDAVGGAVVITSLYGGVDYAESNGAKLILSANIALNSDTYFEYLHFSARKTGAVISARHNNFGIGDGVTVTDDSNLEKFDYPVLIGGYNGPVEASATVEKSYTVEVRSGTWSKLYGGNRRNSTKQRVALLTGDLAVIIRGGTFLSPLDSTNAVEVSGMNVCSGRIYLEISGGIFGGHVFAVSRLGSIDETTLSAPDTAYTADVLVRISGGEFQKRFRLAQNDLKDTVLTYPPRGNATVEITGGNFTDYTVGYGMMGDVVLRYDPKVIDLADTAGFAMHSTAIGPAKAATETVSFTNPISEYPDPYIMEKDGYYYYCYSGNGINVAVHGNVSMGMLSTQYRKVFKADMTDIEGAKKNYWAPEIHYFDAETVGAENAGWYIYFAADDGDGANHRMYVLRATDRENPMSDYEMLGKIAPPTDICAIDGTVMLVDGKMYFVWSGWNDGATSKVAHSQDIYIAPMSNPWTISGDRVRLSTPEYAWEKKGGNSVTAEGNVRPTVNEGPQVLQNGGTTHIIYSASGSWTRYYCYGALTLIGNDPMNASHWYKSATPVFETGNGVYGPGHGSFVKDMDGNWWMYYHANPSLTVPEGATWWSERQTYAKPFDFVEKTIDGKKVSYPNFGTPAAYGSTQKLTAIVTDYHAEGEHWYSPTVAYTVGDIREDVRYCYVCEEVEVVRVILPKPVLALAATTDSVGITWEPIAGASSYQLFRKLEGENKYTVYKNLTEEDTSFTDTGLQSGTRYRYLLNVYFVDRLGKTHYLASDGTVAYTVPVAPTLAAVQNADGDIVLIATPVPCAGYTYYRYAADGWKELASTEELSFTDTDVSVGETYVYTVAAYNAGGVYGACSAEQTVTVTRAESNFVESKEGVLFDAVLLRAGETAFTFLVREAAGRNNIARLPEGASGAYVYALTGEYVTPVTVATDEKGAYIQLPSVESEAVVFADAPLVRYGDANGDGVYSLLDVVRILRGIAQEVSLDRAAADMNGDLSLSVVDVLLALIKVLN